MFELDPHKSFLPESEIKRLITAESIEEYCVTYPDFTGKIGTADITNYVCGDRPARKVFAILVLLNEPNSTLLRDVISEKIRDEHLPLQRNRSRDTGFDLMASNSSRGVIQKFKGWTNPQREAFDSLQWRVLSPVLEDFRLDRPETPGWDQELDSRIIMPWIEYNKLDFMGNSEIIRVRVPPSHIGFSDTRLWNSEEVPQSQYFALKILKADKESEFRMEVKALQKIQPQSHLVTALAWFRYHNQYHLVFPWADGGNLSEFWKITDTPVQSVPSVESLRWLAQQSLGLATGLDSIHHAEMSKHEACEALQAPQPSDLESETARTHMSSNTSDGQVERNKDQNCGRHGDIKPANILWYKQERNDHGLGVLKISDFGLTTFHSALTTKVPAHEVPITETYAAPERYFDAEISDVVSRPFDIWSLGCVYLEFITWTLLGNKALEDFAQLRGAERGRRKPFKLDNFYVVQKSRKWKSNPPFRRKEYVQVKTSVLKVRNSCLTKLPCSTLFLLTI